MEKYKILPAKQIKFDNRKLTSPYRCKYDDKNAFEILQIPCNYGLETRVYEIESKYLPDSDSIHFKAKPNGDSFTIQWIPKALDVYIKRIK